VSTHSDIYAEHAAPLLFEHQGESVTYYDGSKPSGVAAATAQTLTVIWIDEPRELLTDEEGDILRGQAGMLVQTDDLSSVHLDDEVVRNSERWAVKDYGDARGGVRRLRLVRIERPRMTNSEYRTTRR
jgi:hypothetical protein